MASILGRLRALLPGSSKKAVQETVHVLQKAPFYQREPPWWAKLTWGMIAADFLVTTSMTELTWTKWTVPADPEDPTNGERVRKSIWPRAGLCVFHIGVGAGLAAMIFVGRSRVVRTLDILRPTSGKGPKQLFIQGAHHGGDRGIVVPFSKSTLDPGRDKTEVILRVAGLRGHWWIALDGAKVNGQVLPPEEGRSVFMAEWGIRSPVPAGTSGHWSGGPVVKG